jgi:hypothetical protein
VRVALVVGTLAVVCALAPACSSGPGQPSTEVVVGIQSDDALTGALGTLHVVTTLDGATVADEVLAPSSLPHEVHVLPSSGTTSAAIDVRVDGYQSAGWTPASADTPLLVRTAETHFVAGRTTLLRIILQGACLMGLAGGSSGAPDCPTGQTCIDAQCQPDTVPPQALEPYATDWAENTPDICKPTNAGPPVVQVGTGQSDYLPLTAGQTVQMEQGPQGGHHIWIAVRQQNLKQSGSITTITSVDPATGLVGPSSAFVFTFDPDEGGFCKLFGLRYQLDVDGTDYHRFLGQPLDVTVTIKDATGATGTGVAHLTIDPQLLCPSGIPGCS